MNLATDYFPVHDTKESYKSEVQHWQDLASEGQERGLGHCREVI